MINFASANTIWPFIKISVSASDDNTLRFWKQYKPNNEEGVATPGNKPKWKNVCTLSGQHDRCIYSVSWSKVHGRVASASGDNTIKVFAEVRNNERRRDNTRLFQRLTCWGKGIHWFSYYCTNLEYLYSSIGCSWCIRHQQRLLVPNWKARWLARLWWWRWKCQYLEIYWWRRIKVVIILLRMIDWLTHIHFNLSQGIRNRLIVWVNDTVWLCVFVGSGANGKHVVCTIRK
jgi:hypothetical protein